MREWLLLIAPLTVVLYFLAFPDQFETAWDWCAFATGWIMGSL